VARAGGWGHWLVPVTAFLLVCLAVLGTWLLATTYLPRWWADWIAGLVSGRFPRGIGIGLAVGVVCGTTPLLLSVTALRPGRSSRRGAVSLVAAAVLAVPAVLTLGLAKNSGDTARRAQRLLDVEGPGFRGACLVGAIGGLVVALAARLVLADRRRHLRQIEELRARLGQVASDPTTDEPITDEPTTDEPTTD
jgi:hypothetical protein